MPPMGNRVPIAERLERNSIPEPNSGCLLWLCTVSKTGGHGRMKVDGKWLSPHRVAYIEKHGPIPDGLDILHKCDVSCCIEEKHLFPGTHADNMADMKRKGRARSRSKLTEECVRWIRSVALDYKEVARLVGVDRRTIHKIRSGKLWARLDRRPESRRAGT